MNTRKIWIGIVLAIILLLGVAFAVPPVNRAFFARVEQVRLRVIYMLNPPEQDVFTPSQKVQMAEIVNATMTSLAVQPSATPTVTATVTATLKPDEPTATPVPPTQTPTPLPASALIKDVPYVDQNYGYNNCAPANLTMALKFWGWQGQREDVSKVVKPFDRDKNVMPYELVDYVNNHTGLHALNRIGGSPEVLKALISAGYPVIVERGVYLRDLTGRNSWMGHYQVVYGYDDKTKIYQVKDSFETNGDKFTETYDQLAQGWRSFNYEFVVVYPPSQEGVVIGLLGPNATDAGAAKVAFDRATQEMTSLTGQDQFFAAYNRGSSQVEMQDFTGAASSFDNAFAIYAKLPADYSVRPWRIVWYETGAYFAYYYSGRYNDVIKLADTTISAASEPYIEESWYWRAMAKVASGDQAGGISDLKKSLEYHPGFGPSVAEMQQLGQVP